MRSRGSYQPGARSANLKDYELAFVWDVHRLLALGYARLTPGEFVSAQEEDITGCLVEQLEAVLDAPVHRRWTKWLSVPENPPIHDAKRRGKRRRRLDIRVDSAQQLPRSRLGFEAKRLGAGHPVSGYLGEDGLGCFISGRYARDRRIGGMLGYVQAGQPQDWAGRIQRAMARDARKLCVLASGAWREERLAAELAHTFRSGHARPTVGKDLQVFHTLLVFN